MPIRPHRTALGEAKQVTGAASSNVTGEPPSVDAILTEASDDILAEDGDYLQQE